MTKFVHIIQVHPVYNGILQTHKVKAEREFETKEEALRWVEYYNTLGDNMRKQGAVLPDQKAVYYGCVNDETGELV
jgi:hypothetical protein